MKPLATAPSSRAEWWTGVVFSLCKQAWHLEGNCLPFLITVWSGMWIPWSSICCNTQMHKHYLIKNTMEWILHVMLFAKGWRVAHNQTIWGAYRLPVIIFNKGEGLLYIAVGQGASCTPDLNNASIIVTWFHPQIGYLRININYIRNNGVITSRAR